VNSSFKERLRAIVVDAFTINLAWTLYYLFRVKSGWIAYVTEPDYLMPMLVICAFWMLLYFFSGLYRSWYAGSRFDEFISIFRSTTFGVLVLFFAIFIDDHGVGTPVHTRMLIAIYWGLMVSCVGGGRLLQHTFHRRLLEAGIGLRNTLIVGWTERARELHDSLRKYPALGYNVVGFLSLQNESGSHAGTSVLGSYKEMTTVMDEKNARNIVIALDSTEHDKMLDVIANCNAHDVSISIIPDLYDIISGQARTNQIYGFPLIQIMPDLMTPWERTMKRLIDIFVSLLILLIGLPLWIITAIAIKIESRGPVFYSQERVGKDWKPFRMIKFRSMRVDAEKDSGPVWADKEDPRITGVGKIIRSLRIDEVPQLVNVLDGRMSLVGPRPERAFFVEQLAKEIPLYTRRLKVRPGVTGWAQVKHKYDENIDDVRKKVEYDLYYIENMSLRMDFKILLNTIAVVLSGKGH
jgi:exopolysaccharide biosynthesis polyprenyl glycosylphosphotransferase